MSFRAGFVSFVLMDGVFRWARGNQSPTAALRCRLSPQIGLSVCPCVCLSTSVCVWKHRKPCPNFALHVAPYRFVKNLAFRSEHSGRR